MDFLKNSPMILLLSFIIPAIVSVIVCKYQNKIELIKTHSEFIGQLYSKRIKAYLEIYNLVSSYIKVINRKGISSEELIKFYECYSKLDSKYGLLFSYTSFHSAQLMIKIDETLKKFHKNHNFSDNQKVELLEKLGFVETTMKIELGVYVYKDPVTTIKKYEFPEKKKKMINGIIQNYLKGRINERKN